MWRFTKTTLPPYYYAQSIKDAVSSRKEIKHRANLSEIFYPSLLGKSLVNLFGLKYIGIKDDLVNLEDFSGSLTIPPLNYDVFMAKIEKKEIYEGQKVCAILTYEPKRDILEIQNLSSLNIPRKQEKGERIFSLNPSYNFT
ncbi:MAG: hypothetical protein AABW81_00330 [Nanoarchaeota archaeon]